MKRTLWAVPFFVLVFAWFARGAYSYYYTENGASPNWSNWTIWVSTGQMVSQSYGGYSGITEDTVGAFGRMTFVSSSASPGEIKLTYRAANFPAVGIYTGVVLSAASDYSTYYQIDFNLYSTSSYYCLYKIVYGSATALSCGWFGGAHDHSTLRAVRHSNGLILAYLDNVRVVQHVDTSFGAGQFGFITYRAAADISVTPIVSQVDLGYLDSTAPNAISSGSISATPFFNHVDMQWPAASDDTNGSGIYDYEIYRNGWLLGSTPDLSFSDSTVAPSTTYTYTLKAVDFHGNAASTNFSVTTPAVAPEGRRVGVRPTGAYWGAGGENIDVLSGNLNFTLPLLKAQARSGWGVGFNLNYNSQNWRYNANNSWKYGVDVGYGFGWRLMAGSITPIFADAYTVNYYLFTDSTGAEYRLDQNSGSIWSSKESTYVYFDASINRLWFTNGTWWEFGCTSAPREADSGVMYPTYMWDSNGNEIIVTYKVGAGMSGANSSARIAQIEDTRANGNTYTYIFAYDTSNPPHLTTISNNIGSGEGYSFSYLTEQALSAPFNSQSFGTTSMLQDVTVAANSTYHEFSYNNSGELTQVLLPYKGYLAYDYATTTYTNGLSYREVVHRRLSKDGISATQYPFSHEASPTSTIHQFTQLDDPGGVGEKYWAFAASGASAGLVTQYQGRQMPGQVPLIQNDYTWTQDTVGDSYIQSVTTTVDPGQTYAAAKKTDQTVDIHGNVTQVKTYEYGNLTTPVRTDNYTYLNYPWFSLYNRLTSSPTTTITYDEFPMGAAPGDAHEWASWGNGTNGNPTTIVSPAGTQTIHYDFAGGVATNTVNGVSSSVTRTNATNYSAPSQITVGSLSTGMSYSSFLGLTNETGPNGASTTIGYDALARPYSTTSPFGASTTNSYYDGSPATVTTTTNGRWVRATMDGLGRTIKVEAGHDSTTESVTDTEYDSCGCSPTGKMKRTSLPHAPGATQIWTTYHYDGIGRTLTATTDGTETTTTTSYLYQGNTVTVTDATGLAWKKYTMNALGQLIHVNEPNPASGADYVTTYAYDELGHLISVSMPRPSGTQTRSFNYGTPAGSQLLSATNPENGTVTYTYNTDKTLAKKTDAKNQQVQYTYDSYKRVTLIKRGTIDPNNGNQFTEDACQRETYSYDTNPYDGTFSTYTLGRLAAVQYKGGYAPQATPSDPPGTCNTTFTEMYSYSQAGAPLKKRLRVMRTLYQAYPNSPVDSSFDLDATYTYDNEGRMTATQYPSTWNGSAWVAGPNLSNTYDAMGRLRKLTDVPTTTDIISNATYNRGCPLVRRK